MRLLCLMILLVGVAAALGQGDTSKDDLKKLQGKWVQFSVEIDGKSSVKGKDEPVVTVTIRGNQWSETTTADKDGVATVNEFQIDATKTPKHLDTQMEKADKKSKVPGIYKLDGDTLTVSEPFPFGGDFSNVDKRPTEFKTKPGDHFVVIVYKRVK